MGTLLNLEKCKKTEILSLEKYNLFAFYACIEVRCCIFAPTNTSDVVIKIIKYDSTHAKIFAWVMIIDSLIIEGFSNIEHIRLDIGEINALITPNSYGKSNVLSAISFSLMYLNANEETKGQMLFLVLRRSSIFISQLIVTYGLKSVVQFVYDIFNFIWIR